ncbi:unnamed protein product [Sphagnum troendelagicum]|uniref:F-box domain-containing protein n=1 Tax=Sphagnum troendelagicum TaxID=128251 RepID=A0ABP0UVM4_9BRYO
MSGLVEVIENVSLLRFQAASPHLDECDKSLELMSRVSPLSHENSPEFVEAETEKLVVKRSSEESMQTLFTAPEYKESAAYSEENLSEGSAIMDPELWQNLPESLLMVVFEHLPLKSLLRLTPLWKNCKNSELLFSSIFLRNFQKTFASSASAAPRFGLVRENMEKAGYKVSIYDAPEKAWYSTELSCLHPSGVGPFATAGGLLCFFIRYTRWSYGAIVCNPLTNTCRELPPLRHIRSFPHLVKMVMDCEETRMQTYTIFVVGKGEDSAQSVVMEVYNSGTDRWNTSDAHVLASPAPVGIWRHFDDQFQRTSSSSNPGASSPECGRDVKYLGLATFDAKMKRLSDVAVPSDVKPWRRYTSCVVQESQGRVFIYRERPDFNGIWELESPGQLAAWKNVCCGHAEFRPYLRLSLFVCNNVFLLVGMASAMQSSSILADSSSRRQQQLMMTYDMSKKVWCSLPSPAWDAAELVEGSMFEPRFDAVP